MFRNYARLQALPPDLPLSLTPTRPPADENNFNRPTGPQHQANVFIPYSRQEKGLLGCERHRPSCPSFLSASCGLHAPCSSGFY
eukprot:1173576-Prorocentrum_minimum.AAC.1